jgi:hypothetical protein
MWKGIALIVIGLIRIAFMIWSGRDLALAKRIK